jgi:hypothetical protein
MFSKGLTTGRENICQGNFEPLSYVNFGAIDKIKQYLNGQSLGIWINSKPRECIHELTYNSPNYSHACKGDGEARSRKESCEFDSGQVLPII